MEEIISVGAGAENTSATSGAPGRRAASSKRSAPGVTTGLRSFFGHRFVYAVISQRAGGLSLGVNLNPDKACNFDCRYCEVDRRRAGREARVDLEVMAAELRDLLARAVEGKFRELPGYEAVPADLLRLQEVALSGDGEPTLCPNFSEVVQTVAHIRAQGMFPFFKLVLITNATGLALPEVQSGLRFFTPRDEIWAKLDAGTPAWLQHINRPAPALATDTLKNVLANILALARQRPVVIQSLFPQLDGHGPADAEIEAYVARLKELRDAGANIPLVQVYSAHRPAIDKNVGHLPLRSLSRIAQRVREATGLKAEVF